MTDGGMTPYRPTMGAREGREPRAGAEADPTVPRSGAGGVAVRQGVDDVPSPPTERSAAATTDEGPSTSDARREWLPLAARARQRRRRRYVYVVDRDPWWERVRSRVSARIEARRRRHAYASSRPASFRQTLWRLHDERELRRRRGDYVLWTEPERHRGSGRLGASIARALGGRPARNGAIAATAALGVVATVALGADRLLERTPNGSRAAEPRPSMSAPPAERSTEAPPPDEGTAPPDDGAASTPAGVYEGIGFRFWRPEGWRISEVGAASVLESPSADVTLAFARAREGSLEDVAHQALGDLETDHGDIQLLPADLTYEGSRSFAIGGRTLGEGASTRFVVIAVSGPTGNATITVTFAPDAAPLAYVAELERILASFTAKGVGL
jgi:hypothetical protein